MQGGGGGAGREPAEEVWDCIQMKTPRNDSLAGRQQEEAEKLMT